MAWITYGTMTVGIRARRLSCAVKVLAPLAFVLLIVTSAKELWHHAYNEAPHIYEGLVYAREYIEAMGGVRETARVLGCVAAACLRYQTLWSSSVSNASVCEMVL